MRTSRASRVCTDSGKTPGNRTENPPSSPPCRDWPDCLTVFQITGIPHIQAGSARDAFFAPDGGKTLSIEGGKRGIMGLPDDYILPDPGLSQMVLAFQEARTLLAEGFPPPCSTGQSDETPAYSLPAKSGTRPAALGGR